MKCRVCDHTEFTTILDLGMHPRGNGFLKQDEVGKEPFYPLKLLYCNNCATAQLDYTIKKEIVNSEHNYLSGTTATLNQHFKNIAHEVNDHFFKDQSGKSALDIGSNDGTQLKYFKELGYDVLGIDASRPVSEYANIQGIPTINAFFNLDKAREINKKFDVINAAGVFFHLEELHSVTEGIKHCLKENGVFVIQCMYMKCILENCTFDQIYHEHLLFYNIKNLKFLLNKHGLDIFDAYVAPVHGGSLMVFASHAERKLPKSERLIDLEKSEEKGKSNELSTYLELSQKVQQVKAKTIAYLEQKKKEGKTIYGFGAPVKGNTLLNYFGIGNQYLSCVVEKNKLRKGMFTPGSHIPIVMEDEVEKLPDIYFVLAWNFKDEILRNNKHLIDQGVEFYFPLPV